jgi:hypothetical protein
MGDLSGGRAEGSIALCGGSGKMVLAFKALKALSARFKIFERRKKAV